MARTGTLAATDFVPLPLLTPKTPSSKMGEIKSVGFRKLPKSTEEITVGIFKSAKATVEFTVGTFKLVKATVENPVEIARSQISTVNFTVEKG